MRFGNGRSILDIPFVDGCLATFIQPAGQPRHAFLRARVAGIQTGRRFAHQRQGAVQLRQRRRYRIETLGHLRHGQRAPTRPALRQFFHGVTQLTQRQLQRGDRLLQGGLRTGDAAAFGQAIARQFLPRAHAETFAEKVRRQFRQLMRFIDDEGLRARQYLAEAFLLECQVGQQQMMVDHHQVRFLRALPRTHHEAIVPERAVGAEAVVHGRGDHGQQRGIVGQPIQFGDIAVLGAPGPGHDALELRHLLVAGEAWLTACLVKPVAAQVIGTPLQQRGAMAHAQRGAHARQIAVIQLVLQRTGAGGDNGLQARQQCRHQIGKRLAGAGAGFGEQHIALLDRLGDGTGQA
ncbi:hypothetical protein D3C81_692610 [compost metagenome]